MTPPINIDGESGYSNVTIDGQTVEQITIDGRDVFSAIPDSGLFMIENLTDEQPDLVEVTSPYDLTTITSRTTQTNFSNSDSLTFGPVGTRLYEKEAKSANITQYSLSPAFDISSATQTESNTLNDSNRFGHIIFNSDGTKFFVTGSPNSVTEYSVATAWNINTITEQQSQTLSVLSGAGPGPITFNQDGTKMYYGNKDTGSKVYQSELNTAFDVTSINSTKSFDTGDNDPIAFQLSVNGTKAYTGHHSPDNLYQYDLNTAFDITTMTNQTTIVSDSDSPAHHGMYFHIPPHYSDASGF